MTLLVTELVARISHAQSKYDDPSDKYRQRVEEAADARRPQLKPPTSGF